MLINQMSCWLTHSPDTPYNYCTCTCVIMASEIASHKRKLVVLSIHDKLKICELAKKGRTLQSIPNEHKIGKSTVHDIVKNKERVMNQRQKHIHDYFAKL